MPPVRLPVMVLTGPTATGKSAAAIRLARFYDLEVINGDSRLFYRGMDIGTAKPSAEDREVVRHHLIDTLDPPESMSLARFQDDASALVTQIHQRGRLPLIVGGTQQYINAITQGWKIPRVPPQPKLRATLQAEADDHGRETLLERLRELDPQAAASTGLNTRRIIRALEVISVTGQPFSEQQGRGSVPFAPHLFALILPRDRLYARIDERVRGMVSSGLVEEVQRLLDNGVPPSAPAFGSIGYRQVVPYIRGRISLDDMIARIQHDTHRLVRQQETWLRKSSAIPIDVSHPAWFDLLLLIWRDIPGLDAFRREID